MARLDDNAAGEDHPADRIVRTMASRVDDLRWDFDVAEVTGRSARPAPAVVRHARSTRRVVVAGIALAAASVLVFVAPLPQLQLFNHSGTTPGGTPQQVANLTCPAKRAEKSQDWVPAPPAKLGMAGLAPDQAPAKAIVCAYKGAQYETLSGQKAVTVGLQALAGELAWLPPKEQVPCAEPGLLPRDGALLVGLSYPGGVVWVATDGVDGECPTTTNGVFTSTAWIGAEMSAAYRTGRWTAPDLSPTCAAGLGNGRFGQQQAMVPPGEVSLTICVPQIGHAKARTVRASASEVTALAALLDQSETGVDSGCEGNVTPGYDYQLIFGYAVGPPVVVNLFVGCSPPIGNGSLESANGTAAYDNVMQYLAAHPA